MRHLMTFLLFIFCLQAGKTCVDNIYLENQAALDSFSINYECNVANPNQADLDGDGIGDQCDLDNSKQRYAEVENSDVFISDAHRGVI